MARYRPRYDPPSIRRDAGDEKTSSRRSRSPEERSESSRPAKRRRIPEPAMTRPHKKPRPPTKPRVADRTSLSSRVHSLRKLLNHSTRMPADVRQEKERELASLLVEQQEKAAEKSKKKNLAKYHMVRFMERQKCERKLKRLRKSLSELRDSRAKGGKENKTDDDMDMDEEDPGVALPEEKESDLLRRIHTAEVDLNYTLYAPLGTKYIALFAATEPQKIAGMSKANQALLSEEQKAEVLDQQNDALGCFRNLTGEKPPVWHQVEACMAAGTLDQLRDGKISAAPTTTITTVGGKLEAATRQPVAPWLNEDGTIAPEDLDSESNLSDGEFFER